MKNINIIMPLILIASSIGCATSNSNSRYQKEIDQLTEEGKIMDRQISDLEIRAKKLNETWIVK